MTLSLHRLLSPCLLSLSLAGPAAAQMQAPPENVVSLNASAAVEVPQDWITVVLSTTREGPEAATVQSQLKQALDAALVLARPAARPGDLEVRTGNFALHPRYTAKGGSSGWTGQAELVLQGRDMGAVAQLAGRIQTLTVARVSYSLSRAAQEKVEAEVMASAVARFRAQADQAASLFGFTGWLLREVNLGGGSSSPRPVAMAMQSRVADAAMSAPLPVEAGQATVTAHVNGSVQLTR